MLGGAGERSAQQKSHRTDSTGQSTLLHDSHAER
jgi:hypothetical protein